MKMIFLLTLLFCTVDLMAQTTVLNPIFQAQGDHGGRNGGSDLEIELRKRLLQIGQFVNSPIGQEIFSTVNTQNLLAKVSRLEIDVTSSVLMDKYGVVRTCVNEVDKELITCDVERMLNLFSNGKDDIINVILLHEVLGLMSIEHGYQENVSIYPISSLIMPFTDEVLQFPITLLDLRPYGQGSSSSNYGITIVNQLTHEALSLVCIDKAIIIEACTNFNLIKLTIDGPATLWPEVQLISAKQLKSVKIDKVTSEWWLDQKSRMRGSISDWVQYIGIEGKFSDPRYYFEAELLSSNITNKNSTFHKVYMTISRVVLAMALSGAVTNENISWTEHMLGRSTGPNSTQYYMGEKLTRNLTSDEVTRSMIFPIAMAKNSLKIMSSKNNVDAFNSKLDLVEEVLNTQANFNLIGQIRELDDETYQLVIKLLEIALKIKDTDS